MIGIIVADKHEINKIKWNEIDSIEKNGFSFTIFQVNNEKVVISHSGIGVVKAAACTQEMISSFNVKAIFNYGAVGGDDSVKVYDLIFPRNIYFHDVITPWYPRGQVPGDVQFYMNAIPRTKEQKNINIASGMKFINSIDDVKEIQKEIDVNLFDMEIAGIAQICYNNNIPLFTIKCVSDIIGSDSSRIDDINTRITNAGKKAFDKTIEMIEEKTA